MKNICLLFIGILCGFVFPSQAQLSSVVVDPGPYTPGSTIAATFKIDPTACIKPGNVFSLYLSDENGNFANERLIGSYTGFYTTFINATIPSPINLGSGYKVRVRSTVPALISTESDPFEIRSGTAVKAEISSTPVLSDFMFGFCPGRNNASFNFTNQSTPTSTVTGVIKNELNGSNVASLNFTTPIQSFNAALAHYTVSIKAVMADGSIATRSYMVVNNNVFNNFSTSGTNVVCLPGGFLEYGVDVSSQTGIQNNYPGNTYQILWGDGITETYTFCDLKAGSVRHEYLRSSCGNPPYSTGSNIIYNVFGINISVFGPCGQVGGTISTYAKVVTKPENRFTGPPIGCIGQPVTFINTSIAGQDPSANTPECTDNDVTYNWYVDGVIQLSGVRKSVNFVYTFPTNGNHTVKLESVTNGVCEGEAITQPICIQNPPKPAFDITTPTTGCAPFLVKIADKSVLDEICTQAPAPTYNWIVTNANGARFTNFINNVKEPEILFTDPGVYSIVLEISSGACGVVRSAASPPIIIINGQPTISLAADTKLCRLGSYLFDNIPNTPTQTIFTGTQAELADTYTWTITGPNGEVLTNADYTFDAGSTLNSKHPSINFKKNIPYKITVTHKNTCGAVTKSQIIEFVTAPIINLGSDQNICFTQASVNLEASVIGNVISGKWEGGLGTFSTPNNTVTTYTPTTAERFSGLVTLKYTVTTDLQQPCSSVSAEIKIFIKPEVKITSASTGKICAGKALNYAPTSNLNNTTFTWTAIGSPNAGGYNSSTTPSLLIQDILTNSDPVNDATVTYTITPLNDGCQGLPFTYTVTITPIPILTATPAFLSICSNQSSAITVLSNLSNTRYTYNSSAPTGVTGNTNNINETPTTTGINDNLVNNTTNPQTVTYIITPISDNNCPGLPITVNITIQPLPTLPNAGADESICGGGTYVLKGNRPSFGTGKWTEINNTAGITITPDNAENATVSGLIAGNTYTFRWTISTTAECSLWDDVSITVNPVSVGGTTTGTDVVCAGTNSGTITLSNQIGNIVRWESSVDGTNWQTIANITSTLTFSNINVNTSFRAVVQSGACAIAYSTETLVKTNTAAVVANAGTDQTLCNLNNVTLMGIDPGTNAGLWSLTSGQNGVTFTNATLFNTTVNGLVGGQTYTFRWTVTGLAPCPETFDEVMVFNSAALLNNIITTPNTTACNNQVLTIIGSIPTGGNGIFTYVWESSSDGINWTVINGQTNKDLNATVSTSLYYRRTVNSASCTVISNIIAITALPQINNNSIAADQTICEAINPALIVGSEPTGGDGTSYIFAWEQSTDGTTWTFVLGADGKDFQPPSLTQTTSYRRLVSSAACAGSFQSISVPIKITVNQNAKAEFTYANNIGCAPFLIDATNVKAVPYPAQNTSYTWYANGSPIGNNITFPGYTIATDNQTVEIKLVTTSVSGCSSSEIAYTFSTRQNITAAFIQDKTEGCGPLEVNFTNTSTQLTGASFNWNFGNGNTSNLPQPGPIQFLADPAGEDKIYTITLEVTTPCGTNEFSSTVTVKPNPVALFSPNKTSGCSPFTVQFSNTSPGINNTFTYDFGDGNTITTTNKNLVTHTYTTTTVQNFIVKMTASNDCGTSESQYTINVSPNTITPELVVNANQLRGCAPLSVDFFNNTIGASFYRYTFGDGSVITSNNTLSEKQTHIFTLPGTYTVELFATNGCSSATTTETITVLAQPTVAFTSDVTSGCIGSVVKFKNLSQDAVSYLWDFGDGQTSTAFEPNHTYTGPANTYTVTLTAVNALGCPKTYAIANYIRIVPPPTADFIIAPASIISIPDYTFKFTDASTNGAQTYKWTFGDGDESTLKDPNHKYTDTGKYVVTMRTYNEFGCVDSLQKTVQIIGVPGYVYLPNSFIPGGTSSPLQKFTAVGSGIKSWRMQIFNKWGQVIWETNQLEDGKPVEGWDGTYKGVPQPQGIYFWKLDVELINGTEWKGMTYDNKAPKRTGEIYLIR